MGDEWLQQIALLSDKECDRTYRDLHELREQWIPRRAPEIPYYTLGAASTFPEMKRPEGGGDDYYSMARRYNPVLKGSFQWLHDRLSVALAEVLDAPVVYHDPFALPGFQIFGSCPGFTSGGMLHSDIQYTFLNLSGFREVDFANPLAYTMAVRLPGSGGGLNVWDATAYWDAQADPPRYDLEGAKSRLKSSKREYIPYETGVMVLHSGLRIHQVAGVKNPQTDDERISLQGHGLFCDGVWRLFW